jgi:hypothetical protein
LEIFEKGFAGMFGFTVFLSSWDNANGVEIVGFFFSEGFVDEFFLPDTLWRKIFNIERNDSKFLKFNSRMA